MRPRIILRIDSSTAEPGTSATRQMTQAVVDAMVSIEPQARVVDLDLAKSPIDHLQGRPDPDNEHLRNFLTADSVIIGAPMYNFAIPSQLKAWIDHILVAGHTFRYGANGPEGLVSGKQVIIASAAGGIHGEASNFVDPYLRVVLGFMGISNAKFIQAHGMAIEHVREQALDAAINQATKVALAA